ncbi:MAG TPA: hypothetical protein VHB30_13915 [Solirubrobacteraceae bacterium]|nr:hypothetical protein [Solirubrobacteraceae bacterium]
MAFRELLGALRLDLIQRRLLPIPLLLGALLVAMPLIVSSRRSAPVPASESAAAPASPRAAAHRPHHAAAPAKPSAATDRDPFPTVAAAPPAAVASSPAPSQPTSSAGTSSPTGAGVAGSGSTGSGSLAATHAATPSPAGASAPATAPHPTTSGQAVTAPPTGLITAKLPNGHTLVAAQGGVYRLSAIDLRFGTAIVPKIRRDVARLSAFPSAEHPAAILLGARADHDSAVFSIMGDVTVTGEGTCVPRRRLCTQLVLRKGQRALLTRPDGKRLRLELVRVRERRMHSLAAAIAAAGRQSAAGRCAYDAVSAYEYDVASAVVRRAANPSACRYPQLDQEAGG